MRSFRLSKSRIAAGLQCGKRLWLAVHRPQLEAHSAETRVRFCAGDDVGDLARRLHGPGVLIDCGRNLSQALRETDDAVKAPGDITLFEPAFRHRGVLVRSDVLRRRGGEWHMIEVKSATRLKEYHLRDVAIQAWTIEGAGLPLARLSVAVVATDFVYQGGGDYRGLLREIPVADQVRPIMAQVPGWVAGLQQLLAGPLPAIRVGAQCRRPYDCPFVGFCREQEGLPQMRSEERVDGAGVRRPDPDQGVVDEAARVFLEALPYPRSYLDFETVQFAVPRWSGTRPYQQLVFQWSCHREEWPAQVRHAAFLDVSGAAPMRPAAEALISALGTEGPVFVYHDFEKWRLVELARMYPDLSPALEKISGRLVDLLRLTRDHYRHPALGGSFSLKTVLPTVAPDLDHGLLDEVNDGVAAQAAYHEAAAAGATEDRRRELSARLLAYCERDTLGLVRVAHRLARP